MIYICFIFIDTSAELLAEIKKIIKNYCHVYHRCKCKISVMTYFSLSKKSQADSFSFLELICMVFEVPHQCGFLQFSLGPR